MIRNLGSVPMALNMSAYRLICSSVGLPLKPVFTF
jgi:hypothetical protein